RTATAARVVDATPDLSHVVIASSVALTSNAVGGSEYSSLYEWVGGKLALVSVLPSGKSASQEELRASLGNGSEDVRNAISNDGSRIVWEGTGTGRSTHLYMRDTVR